jgi:hypothetical protein
MEASKFNPQTVANEMLAGNNTNAEWLRPPIREHTNKSKK